MLPQHKVSVPYLRTLRQVLHGVHLPVALVELKGALCHVELEAKLVLDGEAVGCVV